MYKVLAGVEGEMNNGCTVVDTHSLKQCQLVSFARIARFIEQTAVPSFIY